MLHSSILSCARCAIAVCLILVGGRVAGCGQQDVGPGSQDELASIVLDPASDHQDFTVSVRESADPNAWRFAVEPEGGGGDTVLVYEWDFGGGEVAEGHAITHLFGAPGAHSVRLTVYNENRDVLFAEDLEVEVPASGGVSIPVLDHIAATEGDRVLLTASFADDFNTDSLTFAWSQVAGPTVELEDADGPVASFLAPVLDRDELFEFELEVSDGTDIVRVSLIVEVPAKLRLAGEDQSTCAFRVDVTANALVGEGEGPRPVGVSCGLDADASGTLGGAVLFWSFDGVREAIPASQAESIDREFKSPGIHTIGLVAVSGDVDTVCFDASTGDAEAQVIVWPRVDGTVHDSDGRPIVGAEVRVSPGDASVETNADGVYAVDVPLGWSGTISLRHGDFSFEKGERAFENLWSDVMWDVTGSAFGTGDGGGSGGGGGGDDVTPECAVDGDCSDGLYCNGDERCVSGHCVAGDAPCDDGVACTADSCDEATDSCAHVPDDSVCDNSVFCDGAEACDETLGCVGGTAPCAGQLCDEGSETCDDIVCIIDSDCGDGLYCNGLETCMDNTCRSGTPIDCDDGVACTADSCDESSDSCSHAPSNAVCDDGLYCNGAETCDAVLGCQVGTPIVCDDGVSLYDGCLRRGNRFVCPCAGRLSLRQLCFL